MFVCLLAFCFSNHLYWLQPKNNQILKWKLLSHVWLFVTPWTIKSMEFSRPGYWNGLAFPFSIGSSWTRNWTGVSCTAGGFFTNWAMREAPTKPWARVFILCLICHWKSCYLVKCFKYFYICVCLFKKAGHALLALTTKSCTVDYGI